MTKLKSQYDWEEVASLLAGGDAPTDDDVSVTVDGRRLDSAQAVIAFFEDRDREALPELERLLGEPDA